MIYRTLKWITGIALHWFYRDIRVVGAPRIPAHTPLFIAVNHQNALVDSLIAAWVVPRRVAMTAKATLTENPFIALLFKLLHVVPLRRVSDEAKRLDSAPIDPSRNAGAFTEILRLIRDGGAVLIFPEGKSHNEPGLEPLKTGLARMAIQARDEWKISEIQILPLGLTFEDKGAPGSVVGARFGEAIDLDEWTGSDPGALTSEIASRLRAVSEIAGLPPLLAKGDRPRRRPTRDAFITVAAWWGRLTHDYPVRIARSMAVKRSTNADEPAMLTILFGLGLVLATYAIHLTIVGFIARSFAIAVLYLASLLCGAYWAAFEQHLRRS